MKVVVFLVDRKLELREYPDPSPGDREVILDIKASCMCGSDLHIYRAPVQPAGAVAGGIKRQAGGIAGHEPGGVGAGVGAGVTGKEARGGQRGVGPPYGGGGRRKPRRAGRAPMGPEGGRGYRSGGG